MSLTIAEQDERIKELQAQLKDEKKLHEKLKNEFAYITKVLAITARELNLERG